MEQPPAAKPVFGWRAAVWPLIAAGILALGIEVPLKVVPLKKEKAEAETIPPRIHIERPAQIGVASWYGDREAGRLTANGDVFDPQRLTAAHRTLPLGTEVRVTHLRNGKSIVVVVNDRGPYIHGRVIDLSMGAAEALRMKPKGLARVKIEIISEPTMPLKVAKRALKKLPKDQSRRLVAMPPSPPPSTPKPNPSESLAEGMNSR
ncbi:MAG TPA: septal ring lytic transglycosylase RlpA family protein [Alphaproteobacteria bacterium]